MRAAVTTGSGGPDVLSVGEVADPRPAAGEVLLDVVATAVNRADTLQRQGFYPPPPGASEILGLECSGRIAELGEGVEGWKVGDEVCALLAGGGYAARVAVPVGQVMPVPVRRLPRRGGRLPEVAATVWSNVFMTAHLDKGERFLVHGGGGGIGTMAIQLAAARGAEVYTTAGSPETLELCRSLGADAGDQLPRRGLRRGPHGGRRRRRDPRQHGRDLPRPQRLRPGHRRAPRHHRDAGRRQGRARHQRAPAQAVVRDGDLAAGAAPRREGRRSAAGSSRTSGPSSPPAQVRPIVETTLPLEDVARAHQLMDDGGRAGKIVLTL